MKALRWMILIFVTTAAHAGEGPAKIVPLALFVGEISGNLLLVEGDRRVFDEIKPSGEFSGPIVPVARLTDFRNSVRLSYAVRAENPRLFRRLNAGVPKFIRAVFSFTPPRNPAVVIASKEGRVTEDTSLEFGLHGALFEAPLFRGSGALRAQEGEAPNGYLRPEAYIRFEATPELLDHLESRPGFHEVRTFSDYLSCARNFDE